MANRALVLQDTADGDKVLIRLVDNLDGTYKFDVNATLSAVDIEIGQVELKDADSSAVANIKAANTARTTGTIVLATQHIAADGTVAPGQPVLTVPAQIIKTIAAIATPEAIAANGTFFQTAMIGGLKAARTANVGTVYLGIGATNDTQPLAITTGEWITITAPAGQKFDLNDFYIDVLNADDGVAVIYS